MESVILSCVNVHRFTQLMFYFVNGCSSALRLNLLVDLVEEVRAQASVTAEPLVRSIFAALDDVSSYHAAPVAQWRLPR